MSQHVFNRLDEIDNKQSLYDAKVDVLMEEVRRLSERTIELETAVDELRRLAGAIARNSTQKGRAA
jgi:hypothetical protein